MSTKRKRSVVTWQHRRGSKRSHLVSEKGNAICDGEKIKAAGGWFETATKAPAKGTFYGSPRDGKGRVIDDARFAPCHTCAIRFALKCPACGGRLIVYAAALGCPSCDAQLLGPADVGLDGYTLREIRRRAPDQVSESQLDRKVLNS